MDKLKKYAKYIILIIVGCIFTNVLTFIGLNLNYKQIKLTENLPEQISIEKAEATKSEGRIYGYVWNTSEYDVNNKYIKVTVYGEDNKAIETQFLKISGIEKSDKKLFRANFNSDKITSYSIDIVEDKEE